jgi:hypothetical protein
MTLRRPYRSVLPGTLFCEKRLEFVAIVSGFAYVYNQSGAAGRRRVSRPPINSRILAAAASLWLAAAAAANVCLKNNG